MKVSPYSGLQGVKLCADCPVTAECLQLALDNGEVHGIWGGKTERQRRRMRRQMKGTAA